MQDKQEELKRISKMIDLISDDERLLTVAEAAQFLKVKKSTIYKIVHLGIVKYFKPNKGKIYFKKDDLWEYLTQGNIIKKGVKK